MTMRIGVRIRRSRGKNPLTIGLLISGAMMPALAHQARAAGDLYYPLDYRPEFNIPKAETPPTIDGAINEDEWRDALVLRGMSGPQHPAFFGRQVEFYLSWDAGHLYVGTRSSIRAGERLDKHKREPRSLGVVFDDSYEFGIDLQDIHQPEDQAPFFYKFILNPLGSGEYQKIYPTIGQSIYNWMPEMEIANRRYADETGQRWWAMELAIDLDDLELPREFRAGDTIRINLARNFKWPWKFSNVPSPSGYLVSRGFPLATLVDDKPYVQVEEFDGLLDRKVNVRARVVNPGAEPAKLIADIRVTSVSQNLKTAGDKVYFSEERPLEVPANGDAMLTIDRTLEHPNGFLHIILHNADDPDAKPVYKYHLSFREDKEKKFLDYNRNLPAFPLSSRFNPVTQKLWLAGDTLDAELDDRDAVVAMTYRIRPKANPEEQIAAGRIERFARYKYQAVVDLSGLKPGEYEAVCALVDKDGNELLSGTRSFTEADEAEKFAEWWNNDIGSPDQLLRPFTALEVEQENDAVRVSPAQRTYDLNALGLPRAIESNGETVLAAPGRLVAVLDGKEHVADLSGAVKVLDAKAYRVRFTGKADAAGIRFTTRGTVEQDGLVDLELTYKPVGAPVEIEHLRLEWAVPEVDGKRPNSGNSLVVIGSGGNYAVRKIGQVPALSPVDGPEGKGVVWDTLNDLGLQGSAMTTGNFYGNVWVGTEQRGLLWAGDSDQGWVPNNEHPAHSVARENGAVIIRNHFISTAEGQKPFTLDHARTIEFEYNASPFRPLDPGFRVNLRSAGNGFGAQEGYMLNSKEKIKGWTLLHPPTRDKNEWPEWYANWKEKADELNRQALYDVGKRQKIWNNTQIALRGYGPKSIEPGVYGYFLADWNPVGGTANGELLTKSYRDYMHHLQERMVKEAHMRQFYYDISFASYINHNLTSDTGYFLLDGRIQPETNDDELRAYFLRTYALMQENGVYPTGVSCHATNAFCLKALPFVDAVLDSEYPAEDYIDTYPQERMIAMSVPHNFGVGINHLMLPARWAAMHDASDQGASAYKKSTFDNPAMKHWGITLDDVEFIPYWRNEHVVNHVGDGLIASLWKRPQSLLIGVCNYGSDKDGAEQARKLALTLDLDALGIPKGLGEERLRIRETVPPPTGEWRKRKPHLKGLSIDRASGVVRTDEAIPYHGTRFFVLHWETDPIDRARLADAPEKAHRALLDWGLNRAKPVETGPADGKTPVRIKSDALDIQAWVRKSSLLLRVENPTDAKQNVALDLDLKPLGVHVDPDTEKWQRFYQTTTLHGGGLKFDGYEQTVTGQLEPGQVKYVTVDRY